MTFLPDSPKPALHFQSTFNVLEHEISELEKELKETEQRLNAFETRIRSKLHKEILRIRELTALYKQLKQAKKAKRLEQKKKGKNYKAPAGISRVAPITQNSNKLSASQLTALKKMYKEAIVQVHPDKFPNLDGASARRATELTIRLNALYKQEALDELSQFHEHILSGNALAHISQQPDTVVNSAAMLIFLEKKRKNLQESLAQAKQSTTFQVLSTYPNPDSFIEELQEQFQQRIRLLEKRTRKA